MKGGYDNIADEFRTPDPDDYEISIHPGPGTCCPESNYVNDVCQGCGHVRAIVCQKLKDRACIMDPGRPGCLGRLDCEGYEGALDPNEKF